MTDHASAGAAGTATAAVVAFSVTPLAAWLAGTGERQGSGAAGTPGSHNAESPAAGTMAWGDPGDGDDGAAASGAPLRAKEYMVELLPLPPQQAPPLLEARERSRQLRVDCGLRLPLLRRLTCRLAEFLG